MKNISTKLNDQKGEKFRNTSMVTIFRQETERDMLIVMDNVVDLVHHLHSFASFVAVTKKSTCRCIENFPKKANWRLMLSQTQILNLFRLTRVMIFLSSNCAKGKKCSHTKHSMWLDRFFLDFCHMKIKTSVSP